MKVTVFYFFLLLFPMGIYAQNETLIDSLKTALPHLDGKEKFNTLSDLCWEYYYTDIEKSKFYSQKEIVLANKLNNDTLFAIAFNDHGRSLYRLAKFDSALFFYHKSLSIKLRLKDTLGTAKSFNKIAVTFQLLGNYDSTAYYYYKAIDIFTALQLPKQVSLLRNNIAGLLFEQENYTKSLEIHLLNLNYREKTDDIRGLYQTLNGIGIAYSRLQQLDSSILAFNKGLKYANQSIDTRGVSTISHNLGAVYLVNNELSKAKKHLNKALKIRQETNDVIGLVSTYTSLGKYFYKTKEHNKAIEMLRKAKALAEQSGSWYDFELIYQYLAELYYEIGNPDKAYTYQVLYTETRDSIRSELVYQQVTEAEVKYETEKKEKELLKTKQEKAVAELIASEKSKQIWLLIGGSIFLLLLGSFLFYRTKQKQKSKLAKIRIEEQQKGLSAVIYAQEEERKRIAKDLHDGIVQQLGGLKLGLQKIFTGNETLETTKIVKILDDSAKELRELSHKMMPRSLSELGLMPALDDMLENSLGNTSINYQFEHFGITKRFKENIEIAIYRIAQELINNVIKHSKANKVNVQLFKTGNNVILIVEDNGEGINTSIKKEGIGLMNISSRLDTINGKVNFEPSPKSGTLATVKIPV